MNPLYTSEVYLNDLKQSIDSVFGFAELSQKQILITGATGLIGSYLTEMFCLWNAQCSEQEKIEIIATGRSMAKLEKRFDGVPEREHLHFVEWNLEAAEFPYAGTADFIIHTASNSHPAEFAADPVGTIFSNVQGMRSLLEYARKCNAKRLLYLSSGEVYGEGAKEAFGEDDYGCVDPLNPRSCYPTAKRTAENLCVCYGKQYGMDVVIARPCHTYGPNVTATDSRATAQFMRKAINHEAIVMKSLGLQMRSYCYIGDCASAILQILLRGKSCEAYNIANINSRLTIAEYAGLTAEAAGVALKFDLDDEIAKKQQTFISRAVLASDKLEALGWSGRYDARTGIEHTLHILKSCNA